MLLFENNNGYKKVCIWKDEIPFNYVQRKKIHFCMGSGDVNWHIGKICIEVKLNPRHVSNYAMICMNYINNQKNKVDIIINHGREDSLFKSKVLPFDKIVCVGLDKEFADAIYEFFEEYPIEQLPSGTIEIISGAYDEVGSSNVAFKKAMELLIFIYRNIDKLDDDTLRYELLKYIKMRAI